MKGNGLQWEALIMLHLYKTNPSLFFLVSLLFLCFNWSKEAFEQGS